MRRRFFTFCSIASLLLCVAACVAWSFGRGEGFQWSRRAASAIYALEARHSALRFKHLTLSSAPPVRRRYENDLALARRLERGIGRALTAIDLDRQSLPHRLRFGYVALEIAADAQLAPYFAPAKTIRILSTPIWFVVLATAALPTLWVGQCVATRRRLRSWRARGLCAACGYDLRGSPSQCPECGAVAAAAGVAPVR